MKNDKQDTCYRCGKLFIKFYELMDTKSEKKVRFCEECGKGAYEAMRPIKN